MATIFTIFRITKVIKRVFAIVLIVFILITVGSPGCGTKKTPSSSHGGDFTVHEFYEGTPQAEGGAVPCRNAKTGRSNPLSYMDVADTGSGRINSGRYGNTRNNGTKFHAGIDLDAQVGTAAYAAADGQVIEVYSSAKWDGTDRYGRDGGGYGNYVKVRSVVDGKDVIMLYAHLDVNGVDVKPGQTVQAGTPLGRTGRTGNAYNVPNPHLHFEVKDGQTGKAVDPEPYLNGRVSESGAFVDVACDNRDNGSTVMFSSDYAVKMPE